MAFIKQLEDVLVLVKELPENYQKEAADSLAWFLRHVENEMTMAAGEIEKLQQLKREASRAKSQKLARQFDEISGKDRRG